MVGSSFPLVGSSFRLVGTYFRPVGSSFRLVGTIFRPVGSSFRLVGTIFRPVGSSFPLVGNTFLLVGTIFRPVGGSFPWGNDPDRWEHDPFPRQSTAREVGDLWQVNILNHAVGFGSKTWQVSGNLPGLLSPHPGLWPALSHIRGEGIYVLPVLPLAPPVGEGKRKHAPFGRMRHCSLCL